jgi:hypothetical protein
MSLEIVKALNILRPDSTWTLQGEDYSSIEWLDKKTQAPTIAEVEAKIAELPQIEAQAKAAQDAEKAALLAKLGITSEEAALLLG